AGLGWLHLTLGNGRRHRFGPGGLDRALWRHSGWLGRRHHHWFFTTAAQDTFAAQAVVYGVGSLARWTGDADGHAAILGRAGGIQGGNRRSNIVIHEKAR